MATYTYIAPPTGQAFHDARVGTYGFKGLRGVPGCLPGWTEVMTRAGWIRIDEWSGQEILQWDSCDGSARFAKPKEYIHAPCCDSFIEIGCGRITMTVSASHRVPVYVDGSFKVLSGSEFAGLAAEGGGGRSFVLPGIPGCEPISLSEGTVRYVQPEDGTHYCFVTDTGFFLVRQNGCTFVTGNSGKSVVCCWDMRYKAEMQPAVEDPETGEMVRWTRWAVVRKTNIELAGTTIKTWLSWFPVYLTDMHNSYPIKGTFRAPSLRQDGTQVRMDLEFYPSDADNFMNALDSLEISGAWVNEAAQIEWDKIFKLQERCGRFKPPGAAASGEVGFMDFGVIMDTNTPLETSWWHEKEQVTLPEDMLFFVQPPAMIEVPDPMGGKRLVRNDAANNEKYARYVDNGICAEALASSRVYAAMGPAENVEHHNGGWNYYEKLVPGSTDEYKRVRLLNQYGRSKGGLAVYKETYNDRFHCTTEKITPMRGLTVFVGMDTGRHPAAVIGQVTPMGQVRIYRDLYCPNMGVPTFVEDHLIPTLTNEFGWPRTNVVVFVDPASNNLSEMSELSPIRYLNEKAGLHAFVPEVLIGKNNDVITRIGSVEELLRGNRGGTPDLLISSECRCLRDGFNGDYKFAKMRGAPGMADKYRDVPEKDEWSHVADAMQYLACGVRNGAGMEIASRARGIGRRFDGAMQSHISCGCV